MGCGGYAAGLPPEVLDLVAAGRSAARAAAEPSFSDQAIDIRARQDRIDQGLESGLSTGEKTELAEAGRRIDKLDTELAVARRSIGLVREKVPPNNKRAEPR